MKKRLFNNQNHPSLVLSMFDLSFLLCTSPVTKKRGLNLLKEDTLKLEKKLKENVPTNKKSKKNRRKK